MEKAWYGVACFRGMNIVVLEHPGGGRAPQVPMAGLSTIARFNGVHENHESSA